MITSDVREIEELDTYVEYSASKKSINDAEYESSKSQLIEWFDDLVKLLESTVISMRSAYDELSFDKGTSSESFLAYSKNRDLILFYSLYYNKLKDVKIQLKGFLM